MEQHESKIYNYALKTYGAKEQIDKTVDELVKLESILKTYKDNQLTDNSNLADSIANVEVMLDQMKIYFEIRGEVNNKKALALENIAIAIGLLSNDDVQNASPQHKRISEEDVINIRREYASGRITQIELSQKYGLDQGSISLLVRGVYYADIGGPIAPKQINKLSEEEVTEIREKYAKGEMSQRDLAELYDVTVMVINGIVRGKSHQDVDGPITLHEENQHENDHLVSDELSRQIKSDYIKNGLTFKPLSEKYHLPESIIQKVISGSARAKSVDNPNIVPVSKINASIVNRYTNRKGVMPGEIEAFINKSYNPMLPIEKNIEYLTNYAIENEWNGMTIKACRLILKIACGSSNRSTQKHKI